MTTLRGAVRSLPPNETSPAIAASPVTLSPKRSPSTAVWARMSATLPPTTSFASDATVSDAAPMTPAA